MTTIIIQGDTFPTVINENIRLNKLLDGLRGFSKNEIKKYLIDNFEYSTKTKTMTNTYYINPYTVLQKKFSAEYGCYFLTQITHDNIT